jgi:vacuolar-type H+-ATPase subunit H
MNPFEEKRKQRIQNLLKSIEEEGRVKRSEILAEAQIEFGATKSTVDGYLQTLESAGRITVEEFEDTDSMVHYGNPEEEN